MTNATPERPPLPESEIMEWLKTIFPQCFIKGEGKKPLKVGIHEDILAFCREHYPTVSENLLKKAVKMYVLGYQYLSSFKAGAPRVDLNGKPSGVVTENDEQDAAMILKRRDEERLRKAQRILESDS